MVINNNPTKIHKINVHVIILLVRKLQSDKTQRTGIILPNGRHISVAKEIISGFLLIFFSFSQFIQIMHILIMITLESSAQKLNRAEMVFGWHTFEIMCDIPVL